MGNFIDLLKKAIKGEPEKKPTVKRTPGTSPKPEPYVYVTKTGKKYHWDADCQALQNAWARNEVKKMNLSKARASGRTACSRCCYDYLHE